MINVEERLNHLDGVMAELAHAQLRSEIALKNLQRTIAEDTHRMKEDARRTEESQRLTEESLRQLSESQRLTEESQRQTEESLRQLSESQRLTEESQRQTEESLRQLSESQRQTEESLNRMEEGTRRMQKAWGDLANKMGTVAEDVVAPNIPRLAVEEFGFSEVEDLLVRARRSSRRGEKRRTEYDVICSGPGKVIVVEVKSSPTLEHVQAFPARLAEFFDFYPEYEGRELIPMVASWSIDVKLLPAISAVGFYGLAMGEDTMEIVARPESGSPGPNP